MSVVLPAPFGPSRPKNSPGSTSRSIPSRATTVRGLTLYTRRIPRASIASGTAGCAVGDVVGNTSLGRAVRVAEYTAAAPSGRPYQGISGPWSGRLALLGAAASSGEANSTSSTAGVARMGPNLHRVKVLRIEPSDRSVSFTGCRIRRTRRLRVRSVIG